MIAVSKTKRQALAGSEEVSLSVGGVRSSQLDTLARHGEARAWQLKWFASHPMLSSLRTCQLILFIRHRHRLYCQGRPSLARLLFRACGATMLVHPSKWRTGR
jgi:hypothetical protein